MLKCLDFGLFSLSHNLTITAGCQYQHMGRYFGDKFVTECGHCNYCVSKSSLEVRQLPVLGSKSTYDRYKEAFGVGKSKSGKTEGKTEGKEVENVEEICSCISLGLKWSYKPYLIIFAFLYFRFFYF
jgi:hypothetical protein